MRSFRVLASLLASLVVVAACGSNEEESGPTITVAQAGTSSTAGAGGGSAGTNSVAGSGGESPAAGNAGTTSNSGAAGNNTAGNNNDAGHAGVNAAGGQPANGGGAGTTGGQSGGTSGGANTAGTNDAGGAGGTVAAGGTNDAGGTGEAGTSASSGSGGVTNSGGSGGTTATICMGVADASLEPPTSCNGPSGDTSKQVPSNNVYSTSWFGCYAKSDGTIVQDPTDNCEFACGPEGLCTSGQSGPECEAGLKWFSADADRYGCGAHILLTNCVNGKQVIVAALDRGPNCGDEQSFGTPVIDMSHDAMIYLFDGKTYGGSDKERIVVEPVDKSTTLGPVQ